MKLLTDEFLELLLDPPTETTAPRKAKQDADVKSDDEPRSKRTKGESDGDREQAA